MLLNPIKLYYKQNTSPKTKIRTKKYLYLNVIQCVHFIRTFSEGKKGIFYLMTYSTQFILRLYGIGHMVNDYSDS